MDEVDSGITKELQDDLQKAKQAIDEHLTAINDNTSEIQALFDYLHELEIKLDKLSQRLDQAQLSQNAANFKNPILPLTGTEKKVFLALYTEELPLSYKEIAEKSQLPYSLVPECLSCLSQKGIPLLRTFCNNQIFFKVEPHFKEVQAKENLINLSLKSFME